MNRVKHKRRSRVASEILQGLTELHEAVRKGSPLDRKFTVRTVELVLKPGGLRPREIRVLRESLGASQEIFAAVLGVSPDAVQSWEQGRRPPGNTALRLMRVLKENPNLFLQQIQLKSERQSAA